MRWATRGGHAKAHALRGPMAMWDATAKATVLPAAANKAASAPTPVLTKVLDSAQGGVSPKRTRRDAIVPPVKTARRMASVRTMISNPVPTRIWAPKAASMHLATSRMVAMAHANRIRPAPAST